MSTPHILCLAEWLGGEPTRLTLEAVACSRRLAAAMQGEVTVLAMEHGESAQALIAHGADEVLDVTLPAGVECEVEACVAALAMASQRDRPAVVLMGHTALGADVAPRLAFRLETGVAMGCVDIAHSDGRFLFTRPRQGGIAREVLSFRTTPVVATLRAGCHEAAVKDAQRRGHVVPLACENVAARTHVSERRPDKSEGIRLEEAKVVVAGGRGLEGPDGFRILQTLADALGGAVGASRVPCDLGWCPRSWQIGLTGKTVTPDLYVAVGISGAGHHLAGCGNAKAIVAINTDSAAAIFKAARYGIVGDYRQVVPALIEALEKTRSGNQRGRGHHGV